LLGLRRILARRGLFCELLRSTADPMRPANVSSTRCSSCRPGSRGPAGKKRAARHATIDPVERHEDSAVGGQRVRPYAGRPDGATPLRYAALSFSVTSEPRSARWDATWDPLGSRRLPWREEARSGWLEQDSRPSRKKTSSSASPPAQRIAPSARGRASRLTA